MFNDLATFNYRYAPILSISPAEMTALEELPDKDKDIILPIIPLRGWVGSEKLEKSTSRLRKAIGNRAWIADIDASFVQENKEKQITGKYPREVFYEIEKLLSPNNGYENWFQYLRLKENIAAIPTIQLGDSGQLNSQIAKLNTLNRGMVAKFTVEHINSGFHLVVLDTLKKLGITNVFVVFDYGQSGREILTFAAAISSTIQKTHSFLSHALISISSSSFPSSFSGVHRGENPIYERQLYQIVSQACVGINLLYSDRGSSRADKIGGGGGIPSPRIDYPLANDWRFIRNEFEDSSEPDDGEKEELYTLAAKDIMKQDYWNPELRVWGTQVIEFTSKGEMLGINSPMRATAVRINIHLHQQLYYDAPAGLLDTDEEWED